MAKKYYAVKKGKVTGILTSWDECKDSVLEYPGAEYKSFKCREDAEAYLSGGMIAVEKAKEQRLSLAKGPEPEISMIDIIESNTPCSLKPKKKPKKKAAKKGTGSACIAYVDGSYNEGRNIYGYGVVLDYEGQRHEFTGCGKVKDLVLMRNIAGELDGAMKAVTEAKKLGARKITIYYDYTGIEHWANHNWKANLKGTKAYIDFMDRMREKIEIAFVKVAAHTGVELNERADELAKQAVGY